MIPAVALNVNLTAVGDRGPRHDPAEPPCTGEPFAGEERGDQRRLSLAQGKRPA
jgi:hypothetical protein